MAQSRKDSPFSEGLTKLEMLKAHNSTTSRTDLDDPSFRKTIVASIQSLEDVAQRKSHLMTLSDMERLVHYYSWIYLTLDGRDADVNQKLLDLIEMAIVTVTAQAGMKKIKDRLEDLVAVSNILFSTVWVGENRFNINQRIENCLQQLTEDIKENLPKELEEAEFEDFFALTDACLRCWPLQGLTDAEGDRLVDTVRRRTKILRFQGNQHKSDCGTNQTADTKTAEDSISTHPQQNHDLIGPRSTSEEAGRLTSVAEEGQAIMQLRQEIEAMELEKGQIARLNAKTIEEHEREMEIISECLRERAVDLTARTQKLLEGDAERKDLKNKLAILEDQNEYIIEELAAAEVQVENLQTSKKTLIATVEAARAQESQPASRAGEITDMWHKVRNATLDKDGNENNVKGKYTMSDSSDIRAGLDAICEGVAKIRAHIDRQSHENSHDCLYLAAKIKTLATTVSNLQSEQGHVTQ